MVPVDGLVNLNLNEGQNPPVFPPRPEQGEQASYAHFRTLLDNQQKTIAQLLSEQKKELFDKVESSKKHNFKQKQLEKQYSVNEDFLKILRRGLSCLEKGQYSRARTYLEELKDDIEEHSEDIIAADFSRHGWLTVSRIRNCGSLPTSVLRQIEKEDDNIDKKRKQFFKVAPRRFGELDKSPYSRDSLRVGSVSVPTRKNPEQLLAEAVKQTRAGTCSHCSDTGHFYRECPAFWQKVAESRKANLKK